MARTRGVSWLRAASLAFPTYVSGVVSTRVAPVTVAGPRRTCTGFRNSRPQNVDCAVSLLLPALRVKRTCERALELRATPCMCRAIGVS